MEKEFEELRLATEARAAAEVTMRQARSAEVSAINRLNAAQKAVDNALHRMKAQSPRDSEWHEQVMSPSRLLGAQRTPIEG